MVNFYTFEGDLYNCGWFYTFEGGFIHLREFKHLRVQYIPFPHSLNCPVPKSCRFNHGVSAYPVISQTFNPPVRKGSPSFP